MAMALDGMQQHDQKEDVPANADDGQTDLHLRAKRATLVPLISSELSPVALPVASPTSPTSVLTTSGSLLQPAPLFRTNSLFPSSLSSSSSSSSLNSFFSAASSSSTSLSSLSSASTSPSINTHFSKHISVLETAASNSTAMTVAKLDPASTTSGGNGFISPSDSPPSSKVDAYSTSFSSSTTTSATTTTTTKAATRTTSNISSMESSKDDDAREHAPEFLKRPARKLGPKMNPIYKGFRTLLWALYFNLGASLISMTQVLSLPLALIAPGVYHRHINKTEGHFGAFLLKMNQLFAPSDIILTGDESVRGVVKVYKGRQLKDGKEDGENKTTKYGKDETLLNLPDRLVLISNHQIYSDWMYLWCFAYLAEKHRALKIILRGDLTWIPVFGWGMRFFDFILLKRNDWAHDKRAIEENLDRASKGGPLWLVVFPEGTVVSKGTRKRSTAFAEKAGLTDHRHVLLPRTSGLFVCISKLRGSVEYIYDATVGYSGVHYGEIPQELYPLPGLYVDQAQPKEINMHLRRFAIKDIPETEPEFVDWVRARWQEKDDLMEEFYTTGKFPSKLTLEDISGSEEFTDSKKGQTQGQSIRIPLKSRNMLDYLSPSALSVIALPIVAFAIRYGLQHSS